MSTNWWLPLNRHQLIIPVSVYNEDSVTKEKGEAIASPFFWQAISNVMTAVGLADMVRKVWKWVLRKVQAKSKRQSL